MTPKPMTPRQRVLLHDLARGADVKKMNGWQSSYTIYATVPRREYIGHALVGTVDALVRAGYASAERSKPSGTGNTFTTVTLTDAGRAALDALDARDRAAQAARNGGLT